MKKVLTANAIASCPDTGQIKITAKQNFFKVNRNPVVIEKLENLSLEGCKQPTDSNTGSQQCLQVTSQSEGLSKVLNVNGKAVLLEDSIGLTNGNPKNTWLIIDAGQTILTSD